MASRTPEKESLSVFNPFKFDPQQRLAKRVTEWKNNTIFIESAQEALQNRFQISEILQAYQIYRSTKSSLNQYFPDDDTPIDNFNKWLNNPENRSELISPTGTRTFEQAAKDYYEYQRVCKTCLKDRKMSKDSLSPTEFQKFKTTMSEKLASVPVKEEVDQFIQRLGNEEKFADYFFRTLEPAIASVLEETKQIGLNMTAEDIKEQLLADFESEEELTIRLVITDIEGHKTNKLKKMISRWFCSWGINHTALQIGPYLVDWNTGELVIPRSIRSKAAIARFAFKPLKNITKAEILKKVSKICVEFNRNFEYSRWGSKFSSSSANCQTFVDAIIKELGLEESWSKDGPIAHYLASVRANEFASATDLMIWHGGASPQTRITNHPQLRAFYEHHCVEHASEIPESLRLELEMMVKSVERCFQMQVRQAKKQGDDEKVEALWPKKDANPPIFRPAKKTNQSPTSASSDSGNAQRPAAAVKSASDSFSGVPDYESEFTGELNFRAVIGERRPDVSGLGATVLSTSTTCNTLRSGSS